MTTNVSRYGPKGGIVDDEATLPAAGVRLFREDELRSRSLADLYRCACASYNVTPNRIVEKQLPEMCDGRAHLELRTLDCSGTYLGNNGCAALIPVVAACQRLSYLFLPKCGLKASAAKELVSCLAAHPGIYSVDLSRNDLGTTVGMALLQLVRVHRRVFHLNVSETLIIPQLLRKIDKEVQFNATIRDTFTVPSIPVADEDPEVLALVKLRQVEEEERRQRAEYLRRQREDELPSWGTSVLARFSLVLQKHRRHMRNVFSVFPPHVDGSASAVTSSLHLPVTVTGAKRALRVLGLGSVFTDFDADAAPSSSKAPSVEVLATERFLQFSSWFGAVPAASSNADTSEKVGSVVNVARIVHALRSHAIIHFVSLSEGPGNADEEGPKTQTLCDGRVVAVLSSGAQVTLDRLYDARDTLLSSFETADVDMTYRVSVSELVNGLAAITLDPHGTAEILSLILWDMQNAAVASTVAATAAQKKSVSSIRKTMVPLDVPANASTFVHRFVAVQDGADDAVSYHAVFDRIALDMSDDAQCDDVAAELRRRPLRSLSDVRALLL